MVAGIADDCPAEDDLAGRLRGALRENSEIQFL
jgi:hypothetical protein